MFEKKKKALKVQFLPSLYLEVVEVSPFKATPFNTTD